MRGTETTSGRTGEYGRKFSAPTHPEGDVHVVGWAFVVIACVMFVGAMLQGVIGFGMVILSFPAIVVIEPELLPQTALIGGLPMVGFMIWKNWGSAQWDEVGWFTAGRPLGIVGALALLSALDRTALTLAGGTVVLVAVVLSIWAPQVPRRPQTLFGAGLVSSLFGTAIAIGGPPIGLLYQREAGPQLRSTISAINLFGNPVALGVLAVSGRIDATDVRTGVALAPFLLAGNASSKFVIPYFDRRLRLTILGVCALAAAGAMGRVLFS